MNDNIDKTLDTMGGDEPPRKDGHEAGQLLLKRYRIEGLLGEGGMGRVYRCFDTVASIYVAIKRVPDTLASNPVEMRSIRDNFALIARLNHPNIANIKNLERDESTGEYFIVMELVEGSDLRDYSEKMKVGELIPVVREIASALDYAHRERIIHRDIKPRNVRVDAKGNVKILDFGIASQFQESMTRVGVRHMETSGTGPYMSPEQWLGEEQDARSDQYSLGILAYEMIVGRPPFLASDMSVLRTMVLENKITRPKEIGPNAWGAFEKALAKKREDRYTSCASFVSDLERGHKLDGMPKGAAAAAKKQDVQVAAAPRKGLRLAVVAVAAVLLVGGLMLWRMPVEEQAPAPAPRAEQPTRPPVVERAAEPTPTEQPDRTTTAEVVTPASRAEKAPAPPKETVVAAPRVAEPEVKRVPPAVEPERVDVAVAPPPEPTAPIVQPEEPKAPVGRVSIRTRPTRAEVTLLGQTKTSPAVFEEVPVGEHEIWINHSDREELIEVVMVEDGQVARHTFDLPAPPPEAVLPVIAPVTTAVAPPVQDTDELPPGARPRLIIMPASFEGDQEARLLRDVQERFELESAPWLENAGLTGYLISSFHQADRFDVLERSFLNEAVSELKLSQTDLADPVRAVKVGGLLNAQYILIPTIRHIGMHKDERHIDVARETMVRLHGEITLGLRMVDVKTTRILSDREVTVRVQRTGVVGRMDIRREVELLARDLFTGGARRSALAVVGEYYPVRVVQVDEGRVLIDQGRALIEKGDRFRVLPGEEAGDALGEIEIESVRDKVSEARILKGGPVNVGMICREMEPARNPLLLR